MCRAVSDPYLVADDLEDVQVEAEPPNKEWVTSETAGSVKDEPQEEPWGDEDVWDDSWGGSWDQWDRWNDNTEKAAEWSWDDNATTVKAEAVGHSHDTGPEHTHTSSSKSWRSNSWGNQNQWDEKGDWYSKQETYPKQYHPWNVKNE